LGKGAHREGTERRRDGKVGQGEENVTKFTLKFMNGWLSKHAGHRLRFYRRRSTDGFTDEEGFPMPEVAGMEPVIILGLTCDDCHAGFPVDQEEDAGQDITA
jgi:hypothetical protein